MKLSRTAFTTLELLVSTALMIVAMIGVVGIFNISSAAASKTAAHAELLEASAALQNELGRELSHIVPGLLIIESPPPTAIRAERPGGVHWLRLRHDRIVFIAAGAGSQFQSFTDRNRGTPTTENAAPYSSEEALNYFGPGIPVLSDGTTRPIDGLSPDASLAASEWTLAHRSILLMQGTTEPAPAPPQWTGGGLPALNFRDVFLPASGLGMLTGGLLDPRYLQSRADIIFSDGLLQAGSQTLVEAIRNRPFLDFQSLWQPSWTPSSVSLADPLNDVDYYTRSGFTFLPRLADFHIEWTDGRRIDPNGPDDDATTIVDNDTRTRWFGLAPDPISGGSPPDPRNPSTIDNMKYQARMRSIADPANPQNPNIGVVGNPATFNPDNPADETAAFGNIEYAYNDTSAIGVTPDVRAGYRAVWRIDNWQYRPKALRFTYRLYDAGARISQPTTVDLNDNGISDPDNSANKELVTRYGQEFSIVVAIP